MFPHPMRLHTLTAALLFLAAPALPVTASAAADEVPTLDEIIAGLERAEAALRHAEYEFSIEHTDPDGEVRKQHAVVERHGEYRRTTWDHHVINAETGERVEQLLTSVFTPEWLLVKRSTASNPQMYRGQLLDEALALGPGRVGRARADQPPDPYFYAFETDGSGFPLRTWLAGVRDNPRGQVDVQLAPDPGADVEVRHSSRPAAESQPQATTLETRLWFVQSGNMWLLKRFTLTDQDGGVWRDLRLEYADSPDVAALPRVIKVTERLRAGHRKTLVTVTPRNRADWVFDPGAAEPIGMDDARLGENDVIMDRYNAQEEGGEGMFRYIDGELVPYNEYLLERVRSAESEVRPPAVQPQSGSSARWLVTGGVALTLVLAAVAVATWHLRR